MRKIHILIKLIFIGLLITSCSGGDSISIQPGEEIVESAGTTVVAKMDILFVIDNSVSMKQEQQSMMENFGSFIENFVNKDFDYRIATVSTDAWVTKGFFDQRTVPPVAVDPTGFVTMEDHFASAEYNSNNFFRVDYNSPAITAYDPTNYAGFADLQFNRNAVGSDYYRNICSRDNYVSSRFSEGDQTKALMGSALGTNNGEAGVATLDADPRYLSGYRLVSSEDERIDTDFYSLSPNFEDLRNRDNSFYSLTGITKPADKDDHIIDIFRNNIMQGLDGCFGESGLESARTALENPFNQAIDVDGSNGPIESQSFPRPDAHLAIIIVSDARDEMATIADGDRRLLLPNYTLGTQIDNDTFSQERLDVYKSYFESISNDAFGYSVHVIVPTGDEAVTLSAQYEELNPPIFITNGADCSNNDPFNNPECYVANNNNNTADPSDDVLVTNDQIQPDIECFTEWRQVVGGVSVPREAKMYTQMAEQTGGQIASICGDFAEELESIARVIIERTTEVKLEGVPSSVEDISVRVDYASDSPDLGFVDVPQNSENGWTYNLVGNSVVFNGSSIPDQGARIVIVFDRSSL